MRFKSFLQYNTLPYQKKGFSYLIYNKIYISASYKKPFDRMASLREHCHQKLLLTTAIAPCLCFLFLFHNF